MRGRSHSLLSRPSHLPCVGRSVASANICHRPPSWGTHYIRHTIGSTDSLQIELLVRPPGDKYQEIIELHLQSIFPYNNKYCDCVRRQENVYKYDGEDRRDSHDSCDSSTWHQLLRTQTTPGTCLSLSLSLVITGSTQHSSHLSSLLYWSSMFSPLTGSLVSGSSLLELGWLLLFSAVFLDRMWLGLAAALERPSPATGEGPGLLAQLLPDAGPAHTTRSV